MDKKFSASCVILRDLEKVSKRYVVPTLQRPFTWEKKNIDNFWTDIIEYDSPYFIGTMVFASGDGSSSRDEIIDGQQRITTISLILIALIDYIENCKKRGNDIDPGGRRKDSVMSLLFEPSFHGGSYISTPRLEFSCSIASSTFKGLLPEESNSQEITSDDSDLNYTKKRFHKNYKDIKKLVKNYVGNDDSMLDSIIRKIENLEIVAITSSSKSNIYKLFQSLNATAVPLNSINLIKNSLLFKLSPNKEDLEKGEKGWQEIEDKFSNSQSLFQQFIRHQWLSSIGYINDSKLFQEFEEKYPKNGPKEDLLSYVKELNSDADIYLALKEARIDSLKNITNVRFNRSEIKEYLEFLSYLNVDQIYPVLLNIYKNHKEEKEFRKSLRRLVSFQFLYKYIPGSPSEIEKHFAHFCNGTISQEELINRLVKLCSGQEDVFVDKFLEKAKYREGKSGDLEFILKKFLGDNNETPISHLKPTIEHIISQTPQEKDQEDIFSKFESEDVFKKYIHKIGNLTVMEKAVQNKLSNNSFKEKKKIFLKDVFEKNNAIAKYDFDNDPKGSIDERGADIAKEVYKLFLEHLKKGKIN